MLPTMRPVLVFELGVSSVSGDTSNAALPCAMFLRTEIGSAVLDEDGSAVDDDCVDDVVELDVDDVDDILSTVVGIGTGELELELAGQAASSVRLRWGGGGGGTAHFVVYGNEALGFKKARL